MLYQHGTAIVLLAGLINAAEMSNKNIKEMKIVVNGAGAAGIACINLLRHYGFNGNNIILCDTKGVIYKGRKDGMNKWKEALAVETDKRSLAEAMDGADVFIGLSVKGAVDKNMVKSMAVNPIIFALANPDPEILPEEIREVRDDAIIATGRSDYENQINNVIGFPYIFRGALDVRATKVNNEMKIAAALSIASLAKETVPQEVLDSYGRYNMSYGKNYIIPAAFDPRLIYTVPCAVAKAAMETGVARLTINNLDEYRKFLIKKLDQYAML